MAHGQFKANGRSKAHGTAAVLGLAILSLMTSCVMPVAATRLDPASRAASVTIALDPPTPFDPATDPAVLATAIETGLAKQLGALEVEPALFQSQQFLPGPAAKPFSVRGSTSTDMLRASLCLTSAIYYEAANEPEDGQRAVAQVILNRSRHPAYPASICGVVYQGTERNDTLCQFTFGCDGSLARAPSSAAWARARSVALSALSGSVFAPVGLATHYHTLSVSPVWNKSLTPVGVFGAHIFFKMPGGAGEPRAFRTSYLGREPVPAPKPKLYIAPALPLAFAAAAPIPVAQTVLAGAQAEGSTTINDNMRTTTSEPRRSVKSDSRYVQGALPESDILPAYRNSGQWIGR